MKTQETTQPGGEKALLQQIRELQQQLGDCLQGPGSPQPKPGELETVVSLMKDIIEGGFNVSSDANPWPWVELRDAILNNTETHHLFSDSDFIHGMFVMGKVTDKLLAVWHEAEDKEDCQFGAYDETAKNKWYLHFSDVVPLIIMGCFKASNHKKSEWTIKENLAGFLKVREAFNLLSPEAFSHDRHTAAKVLLDLIIWCLGYAAIYKR